MLPPSNFLETFTYLDDKLTKSDLKICITMLYFFKKRLARNHQKTFVSRETIADISKCSIRTVATFIQKYEGILISHKNLSAKSGAYKSNEYEFNREFFEQVLMLEECGYLRNWDKKTRIHVLKKYIDNEWFLHEILIDKHKVMNTEIAHGFYSKLHTIKNFFLSRISKDKALQGAGSMNNSEKKKKSQENTGKAGRILEGLPLTNMEKNKLESLFGYIPLKEARENYIYANGGSSNVKNASSFIFICCKNKMNNILKRK